MIKAYRKSYISRAVIAILILASVILTSCGGATGLIGGNAVNVSIIYGSEKEAWLEPLVEAYNAQKNKTEGGSTIVIEAEPMGSIESADAIVQGLKQPTVWSPASSVYIPVAKRELARRRTH